MVEDTPTTTKHGHRRHNGNCSKNGFERGIFQRNSVSTSSMSSMPCDRVVIRCLSMNPDSWRCLGMLHI
jgi:hypothetical protein